MECVSILIQPLSVCEYHITEETGLLIIRNRLHDRLLRTGEHLGRVLEVKQQCAKAIAVLFGSSVIDLQPAFLSFDRSGACTYARAVPEARTGSGNANVLAPMYEILRLGHPDIVSTKFR